MKILYHARTLSAGGGEVHINEMIRQFRLLGHEVKVVCTKEPPKNRRSLFVSKFKSKLPNVISDFIEIAYNIFDYYKLAKKGSDFDFIYERHSIFSKAGMKYSKKNNIPLYLEANSPCYKERNVLNRIFFKKLAKKWEKEVLQYSEKIFCVSEALKRILQKDGVSENKIIVMPNAVNNEYFNMKKTDTLFPLTEKVVIGFVGYVLKWHEIDNFLRVFNRLIKEYPQVLFLLVGRLDCRINKNIIEKNQKNIILFPEVEYEKIPYLIRLFDISILPGCNEYCSPLKIVEYMSMGKAVVAPDLPNIRELIKNNHNGLLFPKDDKMALYRALEKLIINKELRSALGKNARQFVEKNKMSWHKNASQIIDTFKNDKKKKA